MENKKFGELMDSFYDLNDILEICRGYTQCDEPNMKALDNVLYSLQVKYCEICKQFGSIMRGAVNE